MHYQKSLQRKKNAASFYFEQYNQILSECEINSVFLVFEKKREKNAVSGIFVKIIKNLVIFIDIIYLPNIYHKCFET